MEDDGDIERLLAATVPRQPAADLRATILAAIAAELDSRHRPAKWQSWLGHAVAASLLFSVATFFVVDWSEGRRMARWDARTVVRSDVAAVTDAVASVSDEDTARGVEQYLLSQLQDGARPETADLREEIEAIQRWAEAEPFANRSQGDEKTQDHI
ncbi:MAG TPA: hypothetical protein VFI31_22895 [Pirellulales bacterium]|nr:hypothetical protein [Pirellulales bacterium]